VNESTAAQSVQLVPFPDGAIVPSVQITGTATREGNYLSLTYQIEGEVNAILWPELVASPQRIQGLWEQTCLECFIAVPQSPNYWELNLSSNQNWNLFALDGYRSGLQESPTFSKFPFDCYSAFDQVTLTARFNLSLLIAPTDAIELSMTAVIQSISDQRCSYWAIAHAGQEPDFHQRDSFVLRFPGTAESD
jgi:hypothetical protein